ncbi:IS110 family transposase [Bradyrhizobium sp. CB1015]|uniref:IS110 family transposase n=1 Tax=Bradyrhizobium sp. CB1015 TaxID=2976822 RepID=UPI0021A9B0AC|nr:IS110 family transposase [Bradyrhizobium sp. CB1015]UWU90231.1 IS110 family transposase [Bradyrhizobium sp. CB1015]
MMAQNDRIVVGIDVAKGKVDACIRPLSQRQTFPSTAEGHRKLVAWLRKHKVAKAVMEASGGYERDWARVLRQAGIEVRIVDPKRVRSFARSAGRLAKNDTIDAEMIAWFAETFDEVLDQIHDAARDELAALVKARKALIDLRTRLQSQNEHAVPGAVQKAHARVLKGLDIETAKIEDAITATIKATPAFAKRAEIIESVPGLGDVASAVLLAGLPELGTVREEVAAALLGAAPYDDDSGKRRGERHIKGGRRWVRNALYMPCIGAATQSNPVLKAYYERLIAKGKLKKVAVIACMRKLIVILNTMIARGEKWDPPATRCGELIERASMRPVPDRAHAKPTDRRADGVKAVSRRRRGCVFAPALRPADRRSTSAQLLPGERCTIAPVALRVTRKP